MVKRHGRNLRKNKKASLMDILFIAFIGTIFAIVALLGLKIATSINDEINERTDIFNTQAIEQTNSVVVKYENAIDSGFLVLTIGLGLFALILAALVRVHPIFIPLYFIGWIAVIFMSGIFSNIYQGISDQSVIAGTTASLTFIDTIMVAIPLIVGIFGILLMIVQYKIWSADQ